MIPLFATTIMLASGVTAIAFAYYYFALNNSVVRSDEPSQINLLSSSLSLHSLTSFSSTCPPSSSSTTITSSKKKTSQKVCSFISCDDLANYENLDHKPDVKRAVTPCPGFRGKPIDVLSVKSITTIPPQFSASSRFSMCDCLPVEDAEITLSDEEATKNIERGLRFRALPTKITPIVFHKYQPLDLTVMNDQDLKRGVSKAAREISDWQVEVLLEHSILTAFRPILQCIVYASKHAFLLGELLQEYEYNDN